MPFCKIQHFLKRFIQNMARLGASQTQNGGMYMYYKAVFSDVDGTLLNSRHRITARTREAIRYLTEERHIPFILVSARMPQAILPLQDELGINAPIVAFGGALVLGSAQTDGTREAILNLRTEASVTTRLQRLVIRQFPSICFTSYDQERWLVPSTDDPWVVQEMEITGIMPIARDPADVGKRPVLANKAMCMGEPEEIVSLAQVLESHFPELTLFRSKPHYLEIMAPGVNKSAAIQALLPFLGLHRGEIIAVGDNYNDVDMLTFAGLGVAMGNAPDEVKALADEITASHDEDGIAQLIEKHFP
ncbi:Cof-type HAD-IIB family hydrolase [Paenibacillaceae bacterium WGS1546]|uniref:Cof-type HAD-IIB family hydrolase n=1 Tax=Cohnella sp. WGS1546 TaxID=3366810 RepID=UPI00372D11EA